MTGIGKNRRKVSENPSEAFSFSEKLRDGFRPHFTSILSGLSGTNPTFALAMYAMAPGLNESEPGKREKNRAFLGRGVREMYRRRLF